LKLAIRWCQSWSDLSGLLAADDRPAAPRIFCSTNYVALDQDGPFLAICICNTSKFFQMSMEDALDAVLLFDGVEIFSMDRVVCQTTERSRRQMLHSTNAHCRCTSSNWPKSNFLASTLIGQNRRIVWLHQNHNITTSRHTNIHYPHHGLQGSASWK